MNLRMPEIILIAKLLEILIILYILGKFSHLLLPPPGAFNCALNCMVDQKCSSGLDCKDVDFRAQMTGRYSQRLKVFTDNNDLALCEEFGHLNCIFINYLYVSLHHS